MPAPQTTGRSAAFSLRIVSSILVGEPADSGNVLEAVLGVSAQGDVERLTQKAKKAEKPRSKEITSWTVVSVEPGWVKSLSVHVLFFPWPGSSGSSKNKSMVVYAVQTH